MEFSQKDQGETEAINSTGDDGSPSPATSSNEKEIPREEPRPVMERNGDDNKDVDIENLENRPPPVLMEEGEPHHLQAPSVNSNVDLSASMLTVPDDSLLLEDDINPNMAASPLPASRIAMPGPHREEPTLKEKLVDRERQRRKEAERARLKRQFALMSNGGGLVYDGPPSHTGGSQNGAVRENNSMCASVGEESSVAAHADLDEAMTSPSHQNHHHHHHHHNGGDPSSQQPQFGYTMERFLQERGGTGHPHPAARALSTSSSVIREETMDDLKSTETPPDKGVVMERFLNDPVLVNDPPALVEEGDGDGNPPGRGSHDVHRSVSFDIEMRTSQANADPVDELDNANITTEGTMDDQLHSLLDESQSNASVRVEVAPEDNRGTMSMSPGFGSTVNAHIESIGQSSASTNPTNNETDGDNSVDGAEPRVFRLTEAEIQEMAAIEEASIGNAPPSDRDAESLVGELVGEFGTPSGMGNDPSGTNSQGTPTTAMESGSILSGNQNTTQQPSNRQDEHHGGQEHDHGSDMDDIDQNSIDDMAMSASVSSDLIVSPGASLSGSAASVTANPPSEIIGRGEPASTTLGGDDDDDGGGDDGDGDNAGDNDGEPMPVPPVGVGSPQSSSAPPRVVVADNHEEHDNGAFAARASSEEATGLSPRLECDNSAQIREELAATGGPDAASVVNRRLRPGMAPDSPMRRIVSLPDRMQNTNSSEYTPRNSRNVDEFDFDKNDFPTMSPRSHMSDSVRDLPEDNFWTSPGRKMTVSPIHQGRPEPILSLPKEESPLSPSVLAKVEHAFGEIRSNQNITVDAKESEIYVRGDYLSKAFSKRVFPLIMTCLMEIPVMGMISGGSDRLYALLGRQHQQLLIAFIPLIAAVSGNISSQARSLTVKAIDHGHISSSAFSTWVVEECKVSACLGLGLGATVGSIAFSVASGNMAKRLLFGLTVAIAQVISAASAGFTGTVTPLVISFLLKRNANTVTGLAEMAVQDIISTFFTATFSYYLLSILISPATDQNESCMAE